MEESAELAVKVQSSTLTAPVEPVSSMPPPLVPWPFSMVMPLFDGMETQVPFSIVSTEEWCWPLIVGSVTPGSGSMVTASRKEVPAVFTVKAPL